MYEYRFFLCICCCAIWLITNAVDMVDMNTSMLFVFLLLLLTSCHWWPLLEHFPNHQQSFREHSGRLQPLEFPCAWHCPSGRQTRASSPSARHCISLHKCHGNQSVWWTHESLDDLRSTTERDTRFFSLTMSKFWKAQKDHYLRVAIVKTLGVGRGLLMYVMCLSYHQAKQSFRTLKSVISLM